MPTYLMNLYMTQTELFPVSKNMQACLSLLEEIV